ncbi:type IV pilus modification protein PilV [uncultured Tolumonas sp.]|uniref:type IV pilus modification protein PilV n=1 Tax=uncultured Tolumonas sp. TaxID=263765 RepID=UPI0029312633|nr:type IV pilus modification protein PilV [uncultured Tolumonas sp.]
MTNNRISVFSISRQKGFTLLEVMISVVILTVSLLGVAGMYGFAAKFSYESQQHAQAVYTVNDVLERLRIDKTAWLQSILPTASSAYHFEFDANSVASSSALCTNKKTGCTDGLVQKEVTDWIQHLASAFASIPALVCLNLQRQHAERLIQATVTINWYIHNAASSSTLPVLNNDCGNAGIGRRQFMLQTLL